jgi:hypothetical protein
MTKSDVVEAKPAEPEVPTIGVDELFEVQPDANLLVPSIGIAPGPPTGLFGQGYVGKTIVATSIGLSVASGQLLWGVYGTRRGRVLHLDHEQGRRLTSKRFRRQALGMGLCADDLRDWWRAAIYPPVNLTTAGAEDIYKRLFEGYALVIADALKGLTPGVDENSSEIRDYMQKLSRACEATGATCLLLHHAGKTPVGGDKRPRKEMGRGSSGIFDECATVLVATGEKGEPISVTHDKDRELGGTVADFGLRIEDVTIDGDPKGGLRVVHLEREQLGSAKKTGARFEGLKGEVLAVVKAEAALKSLNAICNRVAGGNKTSKLDAIRELLDEGRLIQPGGEGSPFHVSS